VVRWKRRFIATDSSVEQGLEVGRSPGGHLTLEPGNGGHGRTPRTPARERVRTLLLRQVRPAPLDSRFLSVMWGSASADRSLVEIPGNGPPAPFPLRWNVSPLRPGMSDGDSVHPLRQRSAALPPASADGNPPVPRKQAASAVSQIVPRVPRCRLRSATNTRPDGTDLLRQAPNHPSDPTDLLRQAPRVRPGQPLAASAVDGGCFGNRRAGRAPRPPVPASAGIARRREGTKRPQTRSRRRPPRWTEIREMGSASTSFGRWRFQSGFGRCERYPRGFRRLRPAARVTSVTLRPRGSPAATVVGGPFPLFFLGRGTVHTGRRKPVRAAKNANELVRDVLRKPGQPGG
jgi:hypothetical protein